MDATRIAASRVVYDAIVSALEANAKTREPLNALLVWTEAGKALAGLLDRKGADPGFLSRLICDWCRRQGARSDVDLASIAYRVPDPLRMSIGEVGEALRRVQFRIERALAESGHAEGADGVRDAFLTTVRGWFPVGPQIVRSFPTARGIREAERLGVLVAWCERYLPRDPASAKDLGVRISRDG